MKERDFLPDDDFSSISHPNLKRRCGATVTLTLEPTQTF
jgi:hypothetical protein